VLAAAYAHAVRAHLYMAYRCLGHPITHLQSNDATCIQVRTHPSFPELVAGAKEAVAGREPSFVDMDPPEHTKYRWAWAQQGVGVRGGLA
jgi:cytochrome P450